MSISRSIVNHVLGQKKAVLSQDAGNDKNLPTSRLDRRPQDPLGDVRAAADPRRPGRWASSSSTPATASSSSRKTSTS